MAEQTLDEARPGALRRGARAAGNVAAWILLAVVAWFAWPITLHGGTSYVLVSGESMLPTYEPRDLVIARTGEPQVGDVIVYAPEELGGAQIVHRIVGGSANDGWVLQGDNNDFIDPFEPKGDEVRGVVKVHLPVVGHLTVVLLNPVTWFFILLLALAVLIWPSRGSGASGSDDGDITDVTDSDPVEQKASPPRKVTGSGTGVVALVIAATLITMASVTPASAAQLSVTTTSSTFATTLRPCADLSGALTVSPAGTAQGQQYSQVKLANLPASCQRAELPIEVFVHNNGGKEKWTGELLAGATSSNPTIASPSGEKYNANSVGVVVVKIGGWLFLATWEGPAPEPTGPYCIGVNSAGAPTGDSCTLSSASGSGWPASSSGANTQGNFYYGGSTKAPYVVLVVNLADYMGFTPRVVTPTVTGVTLSPGYVCSSLPTLRLMQPVQNYNSGDTFWGGLDAYARANAATATSVCR
ncbi:signal peptidase I [Demequina sp. NBRC 110051]|uniref:signal peptidase I n=1 Tax=Demequina sp. NBRC 110051 TaxID=1570340 RepID=UPI001356533D|nr:signal peptidase I [Demequina sp. NBRC 110051]